MAVFEGSENGPIIAPIILESLEPGNQIIHELSWGESSSESLREREREGELGQRQYEA